MGYLLEALGCGWVASLAEAFAAQLAPADDTPPATLCEAIRAEPDRVDLRLQLGLRYLADHDPGRARVVLEELVQHDRDHVLARVALAGALDALGKLPDAIPHLRAAAQKTGSNAHVWFGLGLALERSGQPQAAADAYKHAIRIRPGLCNAYERLAAICLHEGRADEAIELYEKLTDLEPDRIERQLLLANLYLTAGRSEKAVHTFERALTLEPDNWEARNDLVASLEKAGLIREAIEQLHLVAKREPEYPDTHLKLGDLYTKLGDRERALQHLMRAVEIHPGYLEATVKVGTHYLRAGRYLDAAAWFNRAIEINDRLLIGYIGLGVAQHEAGRTDDAAASLDLAASIEPNTTLLYSEMARLQLKAAVHQEYSRHLNIEVDPGDAQTATMSPSPLSDLIERQIERHRLAVEKHPNRADTHYRLGLLLRHQGRIDEAVKELRHAVAINPVYVKALIKLGLALRELDRHEEAIRVLQQALELKPDYVDLHYQLGCLFAERCHFELAVEHFERCVEGNDRNAEFRANLALALEGMGLIDKAAANWQQLSEMAPDSEYADAARRAASRR